MASEIFLPINLPSIQECLFLLLIRNCGDKYFIFPINPKMMFSNKIKKYYIPLSNVVQEEVNDILNSGY